MKTFAWMLVPLLLILQYEIWIAPGGILSWLRVRHQLAQETAINQQWRQRNQTLITEIQDLQTSNQAIEDHARNDLGMVKPHEVLYQLP